MCWQGDIELGHRTAKKDLVVYKILYKPIDGECFYLSPFMNMEYEFGKTYTVPKLVIKPWKNGSKKMDAVYDGLHCYHKGCLVSKRLNAISVGTMKSLLTETKFFVEVQGYLNEVAITGDLFNPVIVKCIIPKGTEYYINDIGEIVSFSLKPIEELGIPVRYHKEYSFNKLDKLSHGKEDA